MCAPHLTLENCLADKNDSCFQHLETVITACQELVTSEKLATFIEVFKWIDSLVVRKTGCCNCPALTDILGPWKWLSSRNKCVYAIPTCNRRIQGMKRVKVNYKNWLSFVVLDSKPACILERNDEIRKDLGRYFICHMNLNSFSIHRLLLFYFGSCFWQWEI